MELKVFDLGLIDFEKAYNFQKEVFLKVKNQQYIKALILCRHNPVITLGRIADKKNILAGEDKIRDQGIKVYNLERGGDVTYHGPGQLMAYPIFNLAYLKKDIHLFLRYLESVVISLLEDFNIQGERIKGLTGVWINRSKISSMGIAIKNWVTFHGLSINIKNNDMDNFRLIKPCGMAIKMTAVEEVLGKPVSIEEAKEKLICKFKEEVAPW